MTSIKTYIEKSLLENIVAEFDILAAQCENKEKEISSYKEYAQILEKVLKNIR